MKLLIFIKAIVIYFEIKPFTNDFHEFNALSLYLSLSESLCILEGKFD